MNYPLWNFLGYWFIEITVSNQFLSPPPENVYSPFTFKLHLLISRQLKDRVNKLLSCV